MPATKKRKKKPSDARSLDGGDEAELAVGRLLGSRTDPVNTLSEAGSVDKKAEGKSYYGYKTRSPYEGEDSYFKKNPGVAGMAAEDNRVVLNPYSKLKPDEMEQVAKNEGLRIYMRQSGGSLDFELTPEQSEMFKGTAYGDPANSEQAKRTIISRILTGDPSAGNATAIQKKWAEKVLAGASANEDPNTGRYFSHPSGGAKDPTEKPWAKDPLLPTPPPSKGDVAETLLQAEPKGGNKGPKVFPGNYPTVENSDGTRSNVVTIGVEFNGKEHVIPTMWDGKPHSPEEAIARAKKIGLDQFPSFDTEEEAAAWTRENHGNISEDGRLHTK